MADTLTLYTNPQSRGRVARWMLEEVGAPYKTVVLGYGTSMKDPSYLAINPMGKVPAIQHGDTVVTECAAVCAYLADAFPQANLAPAVSDKARGPYYRWLFFTAGPFEAMITDKSLGVTIPAEKAGFVGYGTGAEVLDVIENALKGKDYLLGSRFSAADVYVGAQISFGLQFGSLEKRPVFVDYAARLAARPAAIRANELDNALIPQS
ncbi:MAG TPA: glutathione S-transferase family protein [Terricaulis sp.]|nr:glutathione S-transferase family protein [Terricaulis sp.]